MREALAKHAKAAGEHLNALTAVRPHSLTHSPIATSLPLLSSPLLSSPLLSSLPHAQSESCGGGGGGAQQLLESVDPDVLVSSQLQLALEAVVRFNRGLAYGGVKSSGGGNTAGLSSAHYGMQPFAVPSSALQHSSQQMVRSRTASLEPSVRRTSRLLLLQMYGSQRGAPMGMPVQQQQQQQLTRPPFHAPPAMYTLPFSCEPLAQAAENGGGGWPQQELLFISWLCCFIPSSPLPP